MPHVPHGPNSQLSMWIADRFPPGFVGYAVDVGASDGKSINSTWWLEKVARWTVLSVEPNPDFAPALRKERAFVEVCACDAHPGEGKLHINLDNPEAYSALRITSNRDALAGAGKDWKSVPVRVETLEGLLAKWQFPRLDALCVDVEDSEEAVLQGIDLKRWKPKVVVVEAWKPHELDALLAPFGYQWQWRTVCNDAYVRRDG